VAFCILSRYNQTLFHLSRQHSCSCNIHYFNLNQNSTENTSILISKYQTNYLRLTPICYENETDWIFEDNDLSLQDLENKCDYKLMFLDCDAMTTTTVQTTTLSEIEIDSTENADTSSIQSTAEAVVRSTTSRSTRIFTLKKQKKNNINSSRFRSMIESTTKKESLNNIRKLFTVLATLIAITICAIILVFLWYRCKRIIKRRKKTQSFVEQQRHFNSPAFKNHPSATLRYASSEISGSIYSAQLSTTKSQSEALIEPSPPISKNMETNDSDPVQDFIDSTDKQAVET
jgi:hypothetical protein